MGDITADVQITTTELMCARICFLDVTCRGFTVGELRGGETETLCSRYNKGVVKETDLVPAVASHTHLYGRPQIAGEFN